MAGGSVDVPGRLGEGSKPERLTNQVDHVLPKLPNMGYCHRGQNHGREWKMDCYLPLHQMQTHHRKASVR
ncbi:hypothetical protein LCGC14_3147380 [marine sediment metagenome]|uniref:Uncharacterized protein n=1 Tax=marine sediment metagenome TaxID=412755 RepID=A0A0F8Y1X9_9ZZZZ